MGRVKGGDTTPHWESMIIGPISIGSLRARIFVREISLGKVVGAVTARLWFREEWPTSWPGRLWRYPGSGDVYRL